LTEVGQEQFFGYVTALGILPEDYQIRYAEFSYNGVSTRYLLPDDAALYRALEMHLHHNMIPANPGGIYDKVWITKLEDGYETELP